MLMLMESEIRNIFLSLHLFIWGMTIFNVYNDCMDKVIDGIDLSGQKTLHGLTLEQFYVLMKYQEFKCALMVLNLQTVMKEKIP